MVIGVNLAALNGYKTYIVAGVGILFAWVSYWNHTMDFNTAMETTMAAIGAASIRHGIKTQGNP